MGGDVNVSVENCECEGEMLTFLWRTVSVRGRC